jgi:hypothetical protein
MGKRTPWLSALQNNQASSSYKVHFAFCVSVVQILPLAGLDDTCHLQRPKQRRCLSRNQPFFLSPEPGIGAALLNQ